MRFRILFVLLLVGFLAGGVSGTDWPMFHRNLNHTGYSPDDAPDTNETLWNFSIGTQSGSMVSSPVVVDDYVFIGSSDYNLYAINKTMGIQIWNYTTGNSIETTPAVSEERVFIKSSDQYLYAINKTTGLELWNFSTGTAFNHPSPMVANGKVLIGGWTILYVLNESTGEQIWNFNVSGVGVSYTPAIANGKVFVVFGFGGLFVLTESTGSQIWNYTLGGDGYRNPTVANDRVFIADVGNSLSLIALNESTGVQLWNYTGGGGATFSTPAVANGRVFFEDMSNVTALNETTGEVLWNIYFVSTNTMRTSPAVADGKVFIAFTASAPTPGVPTFYALDETDGSTIWSTGLYEDYWICLNGCTWGTLASPAVADGVVYLPSQYSVLDTGYLFAFKPSASPDITSPNITLNWPQNHTKTKDRTPEFNFTATDNLASTLNCSLYLNGVLNTTNSSVLNGSATIISPTGNLSSQWWNFSILCDDGSGNTHQTGTYWVEVRYWPFLAVSAVAIVGYLIYRRFRRGRR